MLSHDAPQAQEPHDCPDCEDVGWLHMTSLTYGREVQRCDSCRWYETDDDAQEAHSRECGCNWSETVDSPPRE